MKKRVVPFETVETFIDTMRIMFYSSSNQPDYNRIREIFFRDSFEVECEDEHESEVSE